MLFARRSSVFGKRSRQCCGIVVTALLSVSAEADPFLTRDQNPLLAGFGLPLPAPAELGRDSVSAVLNWSSTATISTTANEALIVDNESREWRLLWEHALSDRWSMRLQVPYRSTSGGNLDGFLENWHHTFGLPNGDRDSLPRSQLHIRYVRDGKVVADRSNDASGWGDVVLEAGYQWFKGDRANVSTWLNVEVPTGDANTLNGNEAVDTTASVAGNYKLGNRWTTYGEASLTYLGHGDLLSNEHERWVYSGTLGIEARTWGALSLGVQCDAHSAVVRASGLKMLGDAVTLTFGGNYLSRSNWRTTLGITEDIMVGASPDVTFVFQVTKQWLGKR